MAARTCYMVVANKSGEVFSATTLEGAHAQRDHEPDSGHTIYAVDGTLCDAKLTADELRGLSNTPGTGVRWVSTSSPRYTLAPHDPPKLR